MSAILPILKYCGFRLLAGYLLLSTYASVRAQSDVGIRIATPLLETLVNEQRQQAERVSKVILGAQVDGCQTTVTDVRVRVVQHPDCIRLDIVNTGYVRSQTRNVHPQVLVDSLGNHQFEIIKPVYFDGQRLLTQRGYGTIRAHESPLNVQSNASGWPLIGALADRIARHEIGHRSQEIDNAVAEDLSRDVIPKVDAEADRELALLSERIRTLQRESAQRFGIQPSQWLAASDQQGIVVWARPNASAPAAARVPPPQLAGTKPGEDLVVCLSEELASRTLNRLIPPGLTITDTQLTRLLDSLKAGTGGADPDALQEQLRAAAQTTDDASVFSLQLASDNPFQFVFQDGQIRLRSTFQVLPRLGPPSGMHVTETVFRGSAADAEHWVVLTEGLTTQPAAATGSSEGDPGLLGGNGQPPALVIDDSPAPGVSTQTTGSAWAMLIQTTTKSLLDTLPAMELKRSVDLRATDPRMPLLRLERIQSQQGVLRVSLRQMPRS